MIFMYMEPSLTVSEITLFLDKPEISESIDHLTIIRALEDAVDISDPQIERYLNRCLSDSNDSIQNAALDALSARKANIHSETLLRVALSGDGCYPNETAVEMLLRFNLHNLIETLIVKLPESSNCERAKIISILGRLTNPFANKAVLNLVSDLNPDVRCAAISALAQQSVLGQADVILPYLSDPNFLVRVSAISALGRYALQNHLKPIEKCLSYPLEDRSVRRMGVESIGQIGGRLAAGILVKLLTDADECVAYMAATKLGDFPYPFVIPILHEQLSSKIPHVAACSARSLGKLADSCSTDPLISCLNSPDQYLVEAAISSLGLIGNRKGLEAIFPFLSSPCIRIRYNAIEAVSSWIPELSLNSFYQSNCLPDKGNIYSFESAALMGDPRAREILLLGLESRSPELRKLAIEGLGILKDKESLKKIHGIYQRDSSKVVQLAALWAIVQMDDRSVVNEIVTYCEKSVDFRNPFSVGEIIEYLAWAETIEARLFLKTISTEARNSLLRQYARQALALQAFGPSPAPAPLHAGLRIMGVGSSSLFPVGQTIGE